MAAAGRSLLTVLVLSFTFGTFAGCATSPVASSDAKLVSGERLLDRTYLEDRPGTGRVTLKRDSGFLGGGCTTRVFVNAKPIADLRTSEKVVLHLPPGDYVFSTQGTGMCKLADTAEVRGTVASGVAIAFRIGSPSGGGLVIYATAF
jgi:hypothetical protein